jgi:hypothetical protein
VLGLTGLVYGLGNAEAKGWSGFWTLGPAIAGTVFLGSAVLAALMFRSGPLPVSRDAGPVPAR